MGRIYRYCPGHGPGLLIYKYHHNSNKFASIKQKHRTQKKNLKHKCSQKIKKEMLENKKCVCNVNSEERMLKELKWLHTIIAEMIYQTL